LRETRGELLRDNGRVTTIKIGDGSNLGHPQKRRRHFWRRRRATGGVRSILVHEASWTSDVVEVSTAMVSTVPQVMKINHLLIK
jgi:hypothetical protein